MSGGGKGGSQSTQVQIPDWLVEPSKRAISRGEDIAKIGYVPYSGPDVAALSPQQQAAINNTGAAANAFGLEAAQGGLPAPQTFAGGVQGYSSQPLFQQAQDALQAQNPAQFDFINSFFIDPQTGGYSRGDIDRATVNPFTGINTFYQNRESSRESNEANQANRTGRGGTVGGYTGIGDMFDGGGPGTSGDTFEGGGRISDIGNAAGGPSGIGGGK